MATEAPALIIAHGTGQATVIKPIGGVPRRSGRLSPTDSLPRAAEFCRAEHPATASYSGSCPRYPRRRAAISPPNTCTRRGLRCRGSTRRLSCALGGVGQQQPVGDLVGPTAFGPVVTPATRSTSSRWRVVASRAAPRRRTFQTPSRESPPVTAGSAPRLFERSKVGRQGANGQQIEGGLGSLPGDIDVTLARRPRPKPAWWQGFG